MSESSRPPETATASQPTPVRRVALAGFWARLLAFLIDTVIVFAIMSPILGDLFIRNLGPGLTVQRIQSFLAGSSSQAFATQLLFEVARALYYTAFESSRWQASPGKRMLGLYVTDLRGQRLTLGRAAARAFGKLISESTFLIGFLMAAFTQRKQALHDLIAGCLVLKRTEPVVYTPQP
jgi:uncharacterized RDD family membrane protein YckC